MARKSLSAQVLEEVERANGTLRSVADSVDPIIAVLLDNVAESHRRIQGLCLAAAQRSVNAALGDAPTDDREKSVPVAAAPTRRRTAAHKAPRKPKEA